MYLVFLTTKKKLFQKFRDGGWKPLLENVKLFYGKHDIEIPNMDAFYIARLGQPRHQRYIIIMEHHYQIDIFKKMSSNY